MKTKKTVLAGITITTLLREIILMILFSLALSAFGQRVQEDEQYSFGNKNVDEYELTSFKCRSVEGKVYIMWIVLEPSNECIYVLERSGNNELYKPIQVFKGSKSPNKIELLNSFIDNKPLDGTSYYRVRRVTKENKITSNAYVVNGIIIHSDFDQAIQNNEKFAEIPTTSFLKNELD